MAQWLRWVVVSQETWVLVLRSSAEPRPFCMALSQSVHWDAHFLYFCALYNFFFLGFCQWRTRADRVVNLNTTFLLPLFWQTWTQALPSTRPHVLAWDMGRDYSFCSDWPPAWHQVSGFVYFWFLKKNRKNEGLVRGFSKAYAQDWCRVSQHNCLKRLGHCLKYWKNSGPQWGVLTLSPQTGVCHVMCNVSCGLIFVTVRLDVPVCCLILKMVSGYGITVAWQLSICVWLELLSVCHCDSVSCWLNAESDRSKTLASLCVVWLLRDQV